MGVLQAKQDVTEAEITSHARDNKLYGDYVFGGVAFIQPMRHSLTQQLGVSNGSRVQKANN